MRHLSVRLPGPIVERLDELAAQRGVTRSKLVWAALEGLVDGVPLAPPRPMDEEEIVALLVAKAREGNVAALRTMLAREQATDPQKRALAMLQEMAEERRS